MIGSYFVEDHREIDALLSRFFQELAASQHGSEAGSPVLAAAFRTVDGRLERHIRWEEEILFPAVEERAPELADGPGQVMRMEHAEIRSFLQAARNAFAVSRFDDGSRQAIQGALRAAEALLAEHNEKEEAVYYPLCDDLFTEQEATRILDRIRQAD